MKVVGLVGSLASGKGTVAEFFASKGYIVLVVSTPIKKDLKKRGLEITRKNLQDVGNEMRQKYGLDYWAKELGKEIKRQKADKVVIDGLRSPGEVEFFKKKYHAYILGIDASPEKRLALVLSRKREGDPKTREEFDKWEQRDRGVGEESFGQQVDKCLALADSVIENDGTLEELLQKAETAYVTINS